MKKKFIITVLIIIALGVICTGCFAFLVFGRTIKVPDKKEVVIYISKKSSYSEILDTLYQKLDIRHKTIFEWVAQKKNYPNMIKPGKYLIEKNQSCNSLINKFRSGDRMTIDVTFNNIRTLNELAGKIGHQIEADSADIIKFLLNSDNYADDGFTKETVIAVFIPNTYQMYWNTDAKSLYERMLSEFKKFWNKSRLNKAKEKNLTPVEVSILASIIDEEVSKADEKPRIAGVYLNRLKKGMPLQACPTIKFALNDFTITRILLEYLEVDSPYNTYINTGLPPGPICCPTIGSINAVLNAEQHNYLFFAAKSDFSGYHNFSSTLKEHNRYAKEYQTELNKRRIFR